MSELPETKIGNGWRCPHCCHGMFIRNSTTVHPMMRRLYLQCGRIECGATYTVNAEIERQLSPSGIPNPEVLTVMNELNRRYERRIPSKPDEVPEAENTDKNPPPRFHGVDHAPAIKPLSTLNPKKDAQP